MEFAKNQAIYMQIAEFMLENILSMQWKSGDKVPSVREMASTTQVNPNTIMRTFNYLQDQEIIFNKRGIGYFISDDALDKSRELKKSDFVNHFLPQVFKTMNLLKMDFDDLKKIYEKTNLNGTGNH